jgi:hypothetical protein
MWNTINECLNEERIPWENRSTGFKAVSLTKDSTIVMRQMSIALTLSIDFTVRWVGPTLILIACIFQWYAIEGSRMHSPYLETRQDLRWKNKQVPILTSTLSLGFPASTSLSCIKTLTVCRVLSSGVSCNFMIWLSANLVVKEKQNSMSGQ